MIQHYFTLYTFTSDLHTLLRAYTLESVNECVHFCQIEKLSEGTVCLNKAELTVFMKSATPEIHNYVPSRFCYETQAIVLKS